ncbi:hypothetical protein [Flavobacterium commune]|uniref:Uncharacterized protein n=1 Tax=Flavobacterium commune TaxID=1306519 RepID=A0A1D9PCM3_9FLAO|nr:hypothetical protein [Flavobacterium commune]APA00329.1 hypothetical protein BIW12_13345 [Flavobacterium commune]
MASDLKISFSSNFLVASDIYHSASLRSTYKIFQKKKEKKKAVLQVEGFKKAGFSEKILP